MVWLVLCAQHTLSDQCLVSLGSECIGRQRRQSHTHDTVHH